MSSDDVDLKKLVTECGRGNQERYRELYEHLIDKVYGYVRSRTSREDTAIDLTQDVFVALYKALPRFTYRTHPEFYAYVFQIVRRTLARHYNDRHTQGERSRVHIDEDLLSDPTVSGEHVSDMTEAVATLDPISKEVVILHHWSGYTFGEIGAMLDMTESAARVRHHRAIQALRTYFNDYPTS